MEVLFQNCVEEFKTEPSKLNELTDQLLKDCAKEHHPHNRLVSAQFIQMLLGQINPDHIVASNASAQRYILALDCLRNLMIVNFTELAENKMFAAIILNYSQTLNKIVQKERESLAESQETALKLIARGFLVNQIMLKLLQKSHIFIPEILRFAKISLEISESCYRRLNEQSKQEVTSKDFRIISKLAENSKIPKVLYSLGFKKVWKKSYLIMLIKRIYEQLHSFITTCGYKKNALEISIYKEVVEQFISFKNILSESEQLFLSPPETISQTKQNEEVYLQQTLKVRELTPRFYNEEQSMILSKLRKKKLKLTKKIETELRKGVIVKQQQAHVIEEVRREKGMRQQKKEQLIIQKQTVEVKKHTRQMKKVKKIHKSSKGSKSSNNTKPFNGRAKGKGRK